MPSSVTYRAYLIRMWRTAEGEWRASLDDPRTGERRCFATLEQCVEFLTQATRSGSTATAQPAATDGRACE
jgi:hypothetical protein